ncbi:hypothetical protein SLA2020_232850 [Shorea laevis]
MAFCEGCRFAGHEESVHGPLAIGQWAAVKMVTLELGPTPQRMGPTRPITMHVIELTVSVSVILLGYVRTV